MIDSYWYDDIFGICVEVKNTTIESMNYDVLWLQVVGWDFVDLSLLEADAVHL